MRLYERWQLGREPWFRNLRREVTRQFRGVDAFSAGRVRSEADTFGETPILTVVNLIRLLESHLETVPEPFVDLGCGRGLTCLTAASLGSAAVGFEREGAWVEAASRVASALELKAEFLAGDFLDQNWPHGGTYLVVATAFGEELRSAIEGRLRTLSPGSVVVTVDWTLESPLYESLWAAQLPVDWGTARFQICRVGAAPAGSETS